jgi:hypothetical protein
MQKEFRDLIDTQRKAEQQTGQKRMASDSLLNPQAIFQKWSENSRAFLESTDKCFKWAVSVADGKTQPKLASDNDPCPVVPEAAAQRASLDVRVFLALVPDKPEYAYGTGPSTHLWSVPIDEPRRDEQYDNRMTLCKTHYKGDPGGRLICTINPTAHPNVAGAQEFHKSIKDILDIAWKAP